MSKMVESLSDNILKEYLTRFYEVGKEGVEGCLEVPLKHFDKLINSDRKLIKDVIGIATEVFEHHIKLVQQDLKKVKRMIWALSMTCPICNKMTKIWVGDNCIDCEIDKIFLKHLGAKLLEAGE